MREGPTEVNAACRDVQTQGSDIRQSVRILNRPLQTIDRFLIYLCASKSEREVRIRFLDCSSEVRVSRQITGCWNRALTGEAQRLFNREILDGGISRSGVVFRQSRAANHADV